MPKKSAQPMQTYSVRLTSSDKAWLDETSERHGIPVPTLLVWAIEALRQYSDAHGGHIVSPINIRQLWEIAAAQHPEITSDKRRTMQIEGERRKRA